jgi:hypothetical protein
MPLNANDLELMSSARNLGKAVQDLNLSPEMASAVQTALKEIIFVESFAAKNANPEQMWGDSEAILERKQDVLDEVPEAPKKTIEEMLDPEKADEKEAEMQRQNSNPLKEVLKDEISSALGLEQMLLSAVMPLPIFAGAIGAQGVAGEFMKLSEKDNDKDIVSALNEFKSDPNTQEVMKDMPPEVMESLDQFISVFANPGVVLHQEYDVGADGLGGLSPSAAMGIAAGRNRTHDH